MSIARSRCLLVCFVLSMYVPISAQDGTLQSIRDDVEQSDPPPEPTPPPKRPGVSFGWSSNCHGDNDLGMGKLVGYALTAPWWGPHVTLEGDDGGTAEFSPAPYDTHDGYLSIYEQRPQTDGWGGRISLDNAYNFNDISTVSGRLRLDSTSRFGIDSEWIWLHERRPGASDNLHRGDFNVVVRFAQSERAQFHSGIGVNWLNGAGNTDAGFNFTYGADFFPVKPIVISSSLDWGTIGNTGLTHFRSTLGVMRGRMHLYSGYDFLHIGGNSIHGFLSGIELWF